MQKLNAKEIIKRLDLFFSSNDDYAPDEFFRQDMDDTDIIGLGNIRMVHKTEEIDDVPIYKVFHFVNHGIYIRFTGYYTDWDGQSFDDFDTGREVIPHYFIGTQYKFK